MAEGAITLADMCPKVKSKLIYEYDFGDGWEHVIEVQKIVEPEPGVKYPVCLAGKKACPPEDCGGVGARLRLRLRRGRDQKGDQQTQR